MNKIANDEIINYLDYLKNYILKTENLPSYRIGIFGAGMVNYGFAKAIADIDAIAVYIPTYEEICTKVSCINKVIKTNMGNLIKIIDIRYFYEIAINQSAEVLEVLFTDYYIVDDKYKEPFKILRDNREKILRYNEGQRINYAVNTALANYHKWLVDKDNKKAFEIARLYYATHSYIKGNKCEDCIKNTNEDIYNILDNILDGFYDEEEIKNIYDKLIIYSKEAFENINKTDEEAEKIFRKCIFDMVNIGIKETVNIDVFLTKLTKAEIAAMRAIFAEVAAEGNITISKIVNQTGISRPVFNNLIVKLKEDKVAEITNQGAKGTKIKFTNQDLIRYLETSC